MVSPGRILIVVGSEKERTALQGALQRDGFEVVAVVDQTQAQQQLLESQFDLVVTEAGTTATGPELIKRVRATPRLAGILILVIAEWGMGAATLALSQGANGYEPKPFDANRILASVKRLLSFQKVNTE